jgi:hypothetical protein
MPRWRVAKRTTTLVVVRVRDPSTVMKKGRTRGRRGETRKRRTRRQRNQRNRRQRSRRNRRQRQQRNHPVTKRQPSGPNDSCRACNDSYRQRRRNTPGCGEPNGSVCRDGGSPTKASRTHRRVEPNSGVSKSIVASRIRGRWSQSSTLSPPRRRVGPHQRCV